MSLTWRNTSAQIEKMKPELAILPLASFSSPADSLFFNCSSVIVSEIARQVSESVSRSTLLLPAWPFGTSTGSNGQNSGIFLNDETLWAVVKDIVVSLFQHDLKNIILINDLGTTTWSSALPMGNEIVKTAVRQLNYENPGLRALWIQPLIAGKEMLRCLFPSTSVNQLDDVVKASILLHLRPSESIPGINRIQGASADMGKQAMQKITKMVVKYIDMSLKILETN